MSAVEKIRNIPSLRKPVRYGLSTAALAGFLVSSAGAQTGERIFDGASLKGWHATGKGVWTVVDSALVGTMAAGNPESYLISDRSAKDFSLKLRFWWVKGNSGVNFRNEQKGDIANGIQVDLEGNHSSGWLYDNVKAAYVAQTDSIPKWYKADAWNDLAIEAVGEKITVSLNGHRTVSFTDAGGRKDGVFAFQLHVGLAMELRFRDIEFRDLTATALRPSAASPSEKARNRTVAGSGREVRLGRVWHADGTRIRSARFPPPFPDPD